MVKLQANKKLIQKAVEEEVGHRVPLKMIHNIGHRFVSGVALSDKEVLKQVYDILNAEGNCFSYSLLLIICQILLLVCNPKSLILVALADTSPI